MEIKRSGSQPSSKGPEEYFTGTVRVDPLINAPDPAHIFGALVTFEPGARTAWHTHPLGQTLIVTEGSGLVQRWGGPIEEIRPRDVVRAIHAKPRRKHSLTFLSLADKCYDQYFTPGKRDRLQSNLPRSNIGFARGSLIEGDS